MAAGRMRLHACRAQNRLPAVKHIWWGKGPAAHVWGQVSARAQGRGQGWEQLLGLVLGQS